MAFSEFKRQYSRVEICTLTPDAISSDQVKPWAVTNFNGTWRRGSTAGGCRNNAQTFWMNPQFVIKLNEEDDDPSDNEMACSVVVGLIQKNRRRLRKEGQDMHTIGYAIYEVPSQFKGQTSVHLDRNFFLTHAQKARSETFINLREVCTRFKLPPGEYLVVPSTFEPNKDGDFCLRDSGDGKLGLGEFATLWKKVQKYLQIYKDNDLDGSGNISTTEFRIALTKSGFTLNDAIFQILVARFADPDLTIDFDNFVACLMKLELMFRMFRKMDPHNTGFLEADFHT
ncbi:calpain-2 catalytic subunit-like, partial [Clarias magur]